MNAAQTIRIALLFLDHLLAGVRVELLQTQAGRAFLDTAPEPTRRMLKHATHVL